MSAVQIEAHDEATDSVTNYDNNNTDRPQGDDQEAKFDTDVDARPGSNDKTNLIVNYLPQQMTDDEFKELFQCYGKMKSCKIVRNRGSGVSYGFGFVDYETHEQAMKAIENLNGHEVNQKRIKVAFARPAGQDIKQANLYIKNVPDSWTQDDVKKAFEPYGKIIQVRVLGNNRGVAFVLYDLRKQAEDALEALHGTTVPGSDSPLEIKFAADKTTDRGKNKTNSPNTKNNNDRRDRNNRGGRNRNRQSDQGSFFDQQRNNRQRSGSRGDGNYSNNSDSTGPMRQNMMNNRVNRFAPYMPIQHQQQHQQQQQTMIPINSAPMTMPMAANPAYVMQPMLPYSTMLPTQTAIAAPQPVNPAIANQMVHPAMGHAAVGGFGAPQVPIGYATTMNTNAINSMYSVASNNMNNAANMLPQLGRPMNMQTSTRDTHKRNNSNQDDGVTLFVYNIGVDADEEQLESMFKYYGPVIRTNVVRKTPGGESKGFGFVTLKDMEMANAAITALNGSMKNGKCLQVSLKK